MPQTDLHYSIRSPVVQQCWKVSMLHSNCHTPIFINWRNKKKSRQCHSSGCQSKASYLGGIGSITGLSLWALWWKNGNWASFLPQ